MKPTLPVLLSLILLAGVTGCSRSSDTDPGENPETASASRQATSAVDPAVATLVSQQSEAFCQQAKALQQSVNAFLDKPDTETLAKARQQWRQTHAQYARLAVGYRLAGLTPPQIHDDRDPIDAHPMLPGYLDQVPGYPQSGLVYSEVPMTPEFLRGEHQSTDFYYLTLGLHPLETLLWNSTGQSDQQRVALFIPPAQPADDQVDARARRVDLLRLVAHALPRDAATLCSAGQVRTLSTELTGLASKPKTLKQAVSGTLEQLVEQPLEEWKAHPDGEDRNGMPIWHSPQAQSDFEDLKVQLDSLARRWLPALSGTPEPGWAQALEPAVEQLAERLPALGEGKKQRTPDIIGKLQARLSELQGRLRLDDAGQGVTPADRQTPK